jgi:hypothetical protein
LHEKLPVHLEYHSNDEEAGAPEFAWNHFIDRFNHAQVYSQTDPALIAEDVERMMHEVQGVVLSYTLALGISSRQPAYLDGELRYPPECRGILESVVGALGAWGSDYRSERLREFHQTQTSMIQFLQCLAALQSRTGV